MPDLAVTHSDPKHPIHAAMLLASALARLDRRNDDLPHAPFDEVLGAVGAITGGLSIHGFEHDLLEHVEHAERDAAEDELDDWRDAHPNADRWDAPDEVDGYDAGVEAAADWLDEVRDILAVAGLALRQGEIVPADVMAQAAA